MLHLKIGLHLRSLRQPFKKALHTAARLGVQGVEIDAQRDLRPEELSQTGLRSLRKTLDELNLRVCAVRFLTRRGYNVLEDLDRRVEATKRAMQFAWSLGARVVVNHIGRVPPEPVGSEWELLLGVLNDLGAFSQHAGATLAAKTGSESAEDLQRLLNALPEGAIGVDLDPGNLVINGFSVQEALERLGSRTLHVHAHDGVHDLAQGRGMETPLGRGVVDFPNLLAMLEEQDYQGYLTLERESSDNPIFELEQGVQYLRNL